MGFRNTGIRAALILGLALAVAIGVAASLAQQPLRRGAKGVLPSLPTGVTAAPLGRADSDY